MAEDSYDPSNLTAEDDTTAKVVYEEIKQEIPVIQASVTVANPNVQTQEDGTQVGVILKETHPLEPLGKAGDGPNEDYVETYNVKVKKHNQHRHYLHQDQTVVHNARAILLSCMDFRLLDDIVYFMKNVGYNTNYDQFILAGASLGYNQTKYPEWGSLFRTHVDLAEQLHAVKEIIVIDHDKCGAYKLFHGELTPEQEYDLHIDNIFKFEAAMKKLHPKIKLHAYFMRIDGSVEKIN